MKPIKNDTPGKDLADKFYLLEPAEGAPLYELIRNMPRRGAVLTDIRWIEDELVPDDTYRAHIQGTFRVDNDG